ncbi:hypothetical protein HHI36_003985, partial [Cryptolaemus montrouzieri]
MVSDSFGEKSASQRIIEIDNIWSSGVGGRFPRPSNEIPDDNGENYSHHHVSCNEEICGKVRGVECDISTGAMSGVCNQNEIVLRKTDKINNNDIHVRDKYNRRCVSECVISESTAEAFNPIFKVPQNPKTKVKRKNRLSFSSIFKKKVIPRISEDKYEIPENETCDNFFESAEEISQRRDSLRLSQKFHSALEIGATRNSLHRTPSFFKKILHFGEDSKALLKRSFSVRDIAKRDKSREDLTKSKLDEWKQSLKSLTESDINVSYQDLSYVDYDIHNDINYTDDTWEIPRLPPPVGRSQSVIIKSSHKYRKPFFERGTSYTGQLEFADTETPGGISLPYLPNIDQDSNDNVTDFVSLQKYRRRQQSISSEDGGRSRPPGNGSFSSSGSGCAKLRRHNACRQKNRDSGIFFLENRQNSSVSSIFIFSYLWFVFQGGDLRLYVDLMHKRSLLYITTSSANFIQLNSQLMSCYISAES